MSHVYLKGTRRNLAGLLRVMADEIEAGAASSSTAFAEKPDWDPSHTLTLKVADDQPHDTTMEVW